MTKLVQPVVGREDGHRVPLVTLGLVTRELGP